MIRAVMGDWAYRIPVTSIKGATGNPLSAAGPLELATTAMIMRHGVVPPTTNYEHADPDCDLDYTPNQPRECDIKVAMSNSFGFGGNNCSLIFGTL